MTVITSYSIHYTKLYDLARTDVNGNNPGRGRIRIALVESPERTRMALERIKEAMNG